MLVEFDDGAKMIAPWQRLSGPPFGRVVPQAEPFTVEQAVREVAEMVDVKRGLRAADIQIPETAPFKELAAAVGGKTPRY